MKYNFNFSLVISHIRFFFFFYELIAVHSGIPLMTPYNAASVGTSLGFESESKLPFNTSHTALFCMYISIHPSFPLVLKIVIPWYNEIFMSINWKRGHLVWLYFPNSISTLWISKWMSGHAFRWFIKSAIALFMLKGVHKYPQLAACTLPSSHREHCMVWGSSLSITSHICIEIALILMALQITWLCCPI